MKGSTWFTYSVESGLCYISLELGNIMIFLWNHDIVYDNQYQSKNFSIIIL